MQSAQGARVLHECQPVQKGIRRRPYLILFSSFQRRIIKKNKENKQTIKRKIMRPAPLDDEI